MILRYYIYIRNLNLTIYDLIRLQEPLCNIAEVHAKQHVAWHARLRKMKHQMKSRKYKVF